MVTRVFQPNLTGGIIGEGMYARSDTTKYAVGVKDAVNLLIRPQGGMANRPGFRQAAGFDTSGGSTVQWIIPFTLTNQTAVGLEFSPDGRVRVIFEGAYVIDSSFTAKSVVGVDFADPGRLQLVDGAAAATYAVGDLVYLDDPAGDFAVGEQVLRVAQISGAFVRFEAYDGNVLDLSAGAGFWGNLGAGAVLRKVYSFAHPYTGDDLAFLRFAQDNLDMYVAHRGYAPRKLTFVALDNWSLALHSFNPAVATPVVSSATPSSPGSQTVTYSVAAISAEALEEGLAGTITIANYNTAGTCTVAWGAVAGAVLYNIYRSTAAGSGYIGTVAGTSFIDTNLSPDLSIRPKAARNPFGSTNNYPGVVNFIEQRLALASTNNQPQLMEMSKTAAFTNFTVSFPSQADDGLRFRLRTRELNEIRGMVSGRALFVFTSSAEWVVTGNDNEGVLTPTSIVPRPESYFGSYDIEPLVVGESALFVDPSGSTLRDFLLTLNPNAEAQSRDLTIAVEELFEGNEITSMCYTRSPDRTVWVTLSNGQLLSICYMAEHDIWGWTRHELGGDQPFVYQVTSIREGVRDRLYAIVGRADVNGEAVMTEALAPRLDSNPFEPFFVDAGLSYVNPSQPRSTFSGLLHLRGQEVIALVDGDVIEGLIVDEAGVVQLPRAGAYVHVGLAYQSYLQTLPVDFEVDGLGSMQGRYKAVAEVAVSLKRSRGVAAGVRLDRLNELVEWNTSYVGGPIPLLTRQVNMTVDGDWMRDATVFVVQKYPLPMTVLGVAPEWDPGQ